MARTIHWFRTDLRVRDNTALREACARGGELATVFVVEPALLGETRAGAGRRAFLADGLERLDARLRASGGRLVVRKGPAAEALPRLADETGAEVVTFNRHPSPFGERRDAAVLGALARGGVRAIRCADRTVFEADDVRTKGGGPYQVYTPFKRAWYARMRASPRRPEPAPRLPAPIPDLASEPVPTVPDDGLEARSTAGEEAASRRLRAFLGGPVLRYAEDRDRPALDGTSRLSPYLRFGMISIRSCFDAAREAALGEPRLVTGTRAWMDELVWREFYAATLETRPELRSRSLRPALRALPWRDDPDEIAAWSEGRTGFPLVDAGMRQLRATGWMHNRVRMVVASFLTKDLLADWRVGEALFFRQLLDADPASNAGGWQWAASTGTDAQPWFRIFHPVKQSRRFDPEGRYLRRWIPELAAHRDDLVHEPWRAPALAPDYPPPIVDHAARREQALEVYRAAAAGGASGAG